MSVPCPTFGFIVRTVPSQDTSALRRALATRLGTAGLVVDESADRAGAIVITRDGSQATESDRQLVIALLDGDLHIAGATVSDLVDLTY